MSINFKCGFDSERAKMMMTLLVLLDHQRWIRGSLVFCLSGDSSTSSSLLFIRDSFETHIKSGVKLNSFSDLSVDGHPNESHLEEEEPEEVPVVPVEERQQRHKTN